MHSWLAMQYKVNSGDYAVDSVRRVRKVRQSIIVMTKMMFSHSSCQMIGELQR